eukprot:1774024-Amphidinium_carterae.1
MSRESDRDTLQHTSRILCTSAAPLQRVWYTLCSTSLLLRQVLLQLGSPVGSNFESKTLLGHHGGESGCKASAHYESKDEHLRSKQSHQQSLCTTTHQQSEMWTTMLYTRSIVLAGTTCFAERARLLQPRRGMGSDHLDLAECYCFII